MPKLNQDQLKIIGQRLASYGRVAATPASITAYLKDGAVYVNELGLCWSRTDPADVILPMIPEILECSKTKIPMQGLESIYLRFPRDCPATGIHLHVRIESGPVWRALRASGDCALAPDERNVAAFLMRNAAGMISVLTDYPTPRSKLRIIGGRRYFDSKLRPYEAATTLRTAGTKAQRNSYVPMDGELELDGSILGKRQALRNLFNSLGEWCYFSSD